MHIKHILRSISDRSICISGRHTPQSRRHPAKLTLFYGVYVLLRVLRFKCTNRVSKCAGISLDSNTRTILNTLGKHSTAENYRSCNLAWYHVSVVMGYCCTYFCDGLGSRIRIHFNAAAVVRESALVTFHFSSPG